MALFLAIIQFVFASTIGFFSPAILINLLIKFDFITEENSAAFDASFSSWFFAGSMLVLLVSVIVGLFGFTIKNIVPRTILLWLPAITPFAYALIVAMRFTS